MSSEDALDFAPGTKPHLYYKCLLTQYAQKFMKPLPVYQTHNEGLAHIPKYRSTVFFDGTIYTSSNAFQQRKIAEMDAARIAYFAIRQKSKKEALDLIREDKKFCKSIMAEYAAKINVALPAYMTTQLAGLIPVFRSSVLFNGVNYLGDDCKSKKEAEQLAARAFILNCLDSKSGNVIADIINCKIRPLVELNKVQEINSVVHKGTNVVVPLTQAQVVATTPALPVVTQPTEDQIVATTPALPVVTQPTDAQIVATTPTLPVVAQPTEAQIPATIPAFPVVTQPTKAQIPETIPAVSVVTQPTDAQIVATTPILPVVTQPTEAEIPATIPAVPVVTQPTETSFPKSVPEVSFEAMNVVPVTQPKIPKVEEDYPSVTQIMATTPALPVVTQPTEASISKSVPEVSFEAMNVVPVTHPKIPKVEEVYPPVNQTVERKRSKSSRRKVNKKMRLEARMSHQQCS